MKFCGMRAQRNEEQGKEEGEESFHARERFCLSATSLSLSLMYWICCTGIFSATANDAATPADSPRIIHTGSMRMEVMAMWLAETQTGTSRFVHSLSFGVMARYGIL